MDRSELLIPYRLASDSTAYLRSDGRSGFLSIFADNKCNCLRLYFADALGRLGAPVLSVKQGVRRLMGGSTILAGEPWPSAGELASELFKLDAVARDALF